MVKTYVFLDTSVLSPNPLKPDQAFQRLATLAEEGHADISVSDITVREWASQMAIACEDRVVKASRAIRDLLRQPVADELPDYKLVQDAATALEQQTPAAVRELAKRKMDQFITEQRIHVAPLEGADTEEMWQRYFAGEPPFGSVKARQDIPDAFIYAAAQRIAGQMGSWKLHCVAADKRLRAALAGLASVEAYENLDGFFASDAGRALMDQSELSMQWKKGSGEILTFIAANDAPLIEAVKDAVEEQLPGYLEVEGAIPSDNGTAAIASVQDIGDVEIDWTQQEEFAPGWVFVPFAVECELELDFEVYRSDAFDVPKWVHVSFGDFERDHYFEASGCRPARVTGQLRLQFTAAQLRDRTWQIPATEVDFEEVDLLTEMPDEIDDEA